MREVSASPHAAQSQLSAGATTKRREIKVGGKRVKTVDAHCHVEVPEVADLLKGTPLEKLRVAAERPAARNWSCWDRTAWR